MQKVASLTQWSSEKNYYYKECQDNTSHNSRSDGITLEADQYYYMEMYMINGGRQGYFSAGVEIPKNSDSNKYVDKITEIQKIEITSTPIREILEYKVYNTKQNSLLGGSYKLRFAIENIRDQIKVTDSINADASADTVANRIN